MDEVSHKQPRVLVLGAGVGNALPLLRKLLPQVSEAELHKNFVLCPPDVEAGSVPKILVNPQTVKENLRFLLGLNILGIKASHEIYIVALGEERAEIIKALVALCKQDPKVLENKVRINILQESTEDANNSLATRRLLFGYVPYGVVHSRGAVDLQKSFQEFTSVAKPAEPNKSPSSEDEQQSQPQHQENPAPKKSCCTPRKVGLFAAVAVTAGLWVGSLTAGVLTGVITLTTAAIIAASFVGAVLLVLLIALCAMRMKAKQSERNRYELLLNPVQHKSEKESHSKPQQNPAQKKSSCVAKCGMFSAVTVSAGIRVGLPAAGVLTGVISLSTVGIIAGSLVGAMLLLFILLLAMRMKRQRQADQTRMLALAHMDPW